MEDSGTLQFKKSYSRPFQLSRSRKKLILHELKIRAFLGPLNISAALEVILYRLRVKCHAQWHKSGSLVVLGFKPNIPITSTVP